MKIQIIALLCALLFWPCLARPADLLDNLTYDASNTSDYFGSGKFILPNEKNFHLFQPSLTEKKGALVSVGSFRILETASRGEFEHIVMLDIDPNIVAFNKWQAELLKKSPTLEDFIKNVDIQSQIPGVTAEINGSKYIQSIKAIDEEKGRALTDKSFLTDEARYQKLRKLALEGKIHIAQASLTAPELIEIGKRLASAKIEISVLDLSNTPDYFLTGKKPQATEFRNNLKALPFSSDARINFTTELGIKAPSPNHDHWKYYSWPTNQFKEMMQKTNSLSEFIQQIDHPLRTSYSYTLVPTIQIANCGQKFAQLSTP